MKTFIVFVGIAYFISMFGCALDPVILHGDINGTVTDSETSQPITYAKINLLPSGDSVYTDSTGFFFLKNKVPGNYEIRASKHTYADQTMIITVKPAGVVNVEFDLNGIPVAVISDSYLDFGVDSSVRSFTISNSGKGTFSYSIAVSQDWISVDPTSSDAIAEMETITVTINRDLIPESKIK